MGIHSRFPFTEKEATVNGLFLTAMVAGCWRSFRKIVADDSFYLTCFRVQTVPRS